MAKCPSCSADNPDGAKVCEFCGSAMQAAAAASNDSVSSPSAEQGGEPKGGVKSFKCESCGAVVAYSAGQQALACAYCGSNYVVDVPTQADKVRPKRIVPFVVEKLKATGLFKTWLGKGFWRPKDLKSKASLGHLLGVYLPFWAFDTKAESAWTASAGYRYTTTETYTDAQGKTQTRNVTKTRWQPADGHHRLQYHNWLVSASGGLEQEWVSKIIPFDLTKAHPYSPDFMAGWAAEEYSVEPAQAKTVAEGELKDQEKQKCAEMVPGDTHKDLRVSSTFSEWLNELVVLPIWISSYRYKDKVYRFLVNGQTGEVVGHAPISKTKIAIAIILGVLIVGGIVTAVALQNR